jgi:hypothetical protein
LFSTTYVTKVSDDLKTFIYSYYHVIMGDIMRKLSTTIIFISIFLMCFQPAFIIRASDSSSVPLNQTLQNKTAENMMTPMTSEVHFSNPNSNWDFGMDVEQLAHIFIM